MSEWVIGWSIGGAVVTVVALLLIWIIATAWSIEKHARRALGALRRIERNTGAVWKLAGVADGLGHIADHADAIKRRTAAAAAPGGQRSARGRP